MTDRVDADAADHRGDGAVRLGLDPCGAMLQAEMRDPRQQNATRCSARAFGQRRHGLRRRMQHQQRRVASAERNSLAGLRIHRRPCPRRAPARRCRAQARRAVPRALRKSSWSPAIRAATPPSPRPSGVVPIPSSNRAIGPKPRIPSRIRPSGRVRLGRLRLLLCPSRLRIGACAIGARHGCGSIPSACGSCGPKQQAGHAIDESTVAQLWPSGDISRVATSGDGPDHAVRPRRRHEAELPGVDDPGCVRIVGARLERRAPEPRTSPTRLTSQREGSVGSGNTRIWPRRARPKRSASRPSPGLSVGRIESSTTANRRSGQRRGAWFRPWPKGKLRACCFDSSPTPPPPMPTAICTAVSTIPRRPRSRRCPA